MSQAINQPSDCCTPCESPVVENVPGPTGAAGAGGTNGTNGVNSFTDTTANYTQPAVGANVTISVGTSAWAVVGQEIVTESGGYYLVISKPTSASISIQNRGYTANAAPGVVIASGSHVGPAGEKGTAGTNGSTANIPLTTKGDVFGYDSAPARIPVGTDGKVLAADSAQALGLNYVTIQPNSATDNAIPRYDGAAGKPVPQQDSKVVITDDGALQASGSGGNARGARAVDLQVIRSDATAVASGTESVVSGGLNNTASGVNSTVSGGSGNIASGLASFIGGGGGNRAQAELSAIFSGNSAFADCYGQVTHSSGKFTDEGDAQTSELVWRNITTGATPTELFLNGSSERAVMRLASWVFEITIVGRDELNGYSACWKVTGGIKKTGVTTTALIATVTVTLIAADAGSISDGWGIAGSVAVTADNTNDALVITVTGAAATNIRWVAHARIVEVYWPEP